MKEFQHWQERPANSFYQESADGASSTQKCILLKTRGEARSIIGTSYPIFQFKKDSIDLDLTIKYKTKDCKSLLLTLNTIDRNANVISKDTMNLSLAEEWTTIRESLVTSNGFMLEVSIEAEGKEGKAYGYVHLSEFEMTSGSMNLRDVTSDDRICTIPNSAILPYKAVMTSALMNKKILALGETIYGTQTLSDIGSDIIKERILTHNCNLITFDLPLSASLYIDRYVKGDTRFNEQTMTEYLVPFTRLH